MAARNCPEKGDRGTEEDCEHRNLNFISRERLSLKSFNRRERRVTRKVRKKETVEILISAASA
jgi:hypothetical protein